MRGADRGQGFTLEGVFASLLVVTALLFALQVTSPTAYASDTAGESAGLQQQADDLLAAAEDDGTLSRVVLCGGWNRTDGGTPNPEASPYNAIGNDVIDTELDPADRHNATEFGYMLNRTFSERGYRYSVEFAYMTNPSGDRAVESVFPSDGVDAPRNAIVATRTITLYDDMRTTGINASNPGRPNKYCDAGRDGVRLGDVNEPVSAHPKDEFYADDVGVGRELYNVVEVRVMVW